MPNPLTSSAYHEVRRAVAGADTAANPGDRASALEAAAYSFAVLERTRQNADREVQDRATAAATELRNEGLSPDLIGFWLVVAKVKGLSAAAPAEMRLADELAITRLAEGIASPVYRAGAMAALGRTLAAANSPAAARRAAERVLAVAAEINDRGARTAAANAAAAIAAKAANLDDALTVQAVSMMTRARDRSYAGYALARDALKGTDLATADDRQLVAAARNALGPRDLRTSMHLIFAVAPEESSRTSLLSKLLEAAAQASDFDVAQRVSLAFRDKDDQEDAVRATVSRMIDGGEPLRALTAVERLFLGSAKANAFRDLAVDLDKSGYTQVADDAFERAVEAASGYPETTAGVARSLANAKRLDRAAEVAATLSQAEALSTANAAIAKSLSDMGRVREAEALPPTLVEAKDRSIALSGIARAKAKDGDIAAALAIVPSLVNEEHKDRVLAAVVDAEARRGDFEASRKAALAVGDAGRRLESFLRLYRLSVKQSDTRVMRQALGQAVEIAKNQAGADRDDALAEITKAQAEVGDIDGATAVADSIQDAKKRDRARAEITKALARKKRMTEAQSMLETLASGELREETLAEIAPTLLEEGEALKSVYRQLTAIGDHKLRRAALRGSAEALALRLDVLGRLTSGDAERSPASGPALAVSTAGAVTFRNKGIELLELKGAPSGYRKFELPSLGVGAADVRSRMPAPRDGHASIALMTENGYFTKFFEDLPRGRFGVEAAAHFQGLAAPRYLLIERGVVSLRDLEARFPKAVVSVNGALVVRLPILVSPGATLVISGLDARRVHLSADAGVFIVNAGKLYVVDAEVAGWNEGAGKVAWHEKEDSGNFRPFLISWSHSETFVAGSRLVAFGYQSSKSFGLSFSSGPSNVMKRHSDKGEPSGIVVDNLFENFEYGVYTYEAQQVVMVGNEYKDNILYGMDPHGRVGII